MKFSDLVFEKQGCCGEVEVATVSSGDLLVSVRRTESGFLVTKIRNGVMIGRPQAVAAEADVEALF